MKILLVDDTVEIREFIAMKLGKLGEVTQVTSGNQAARILETEKFDFIVSDFNMPDGNGDVVLAAKLKQGLVVPFVYFSSETSLKLQPGVLAIFDKFEIPKLLSFVRQFATGEKA